MNIAELAILQLSSCSPLLALIEVRPGHKVIRCQLNTEIFLEWCKAKHVEGLWVSVHVLDDGSVDVLIDCSHLLRCVRIRRLNDDELKMRHGFHNIQLNRCIRNLQGGNLVESDRDFRLMLGQTHLGVRRSKDVLVSSTSAG